MAEGGGSVWGRVVDRSGNAVPNALVQWVERRPGDGPALSRIRCFPFATTDGTGGFWASRLPPGPCLLVPDRENLCVTEDGGRIDHGTLLDLPLANGAPETVLKFPHVPHDFSRIRGTILFPDKRIARHWPIALLHPDRPQPAGHTRTDDEGAFEIPRVRPGTYNLVVNGSAESADGASPITLEGGKTLTMTITLQPRAAGPRHRARAICSDENGVPLAGVLVVFNGINFNSPPVRSGADGVAVAESMPVTPVGATGNLEGRFASIVQGMADGGEMPEVLLTLRHAHMLDVEVSDAATGDLIPRYNVHVRHEVGMAADECGPMPRGIPGRGKMSHGRLPVIVGTCKIMVEAPGYEGVEKEVDVPPEGLKGAVKVTMRPR